MDERKRRKILSELGRIVGEEYVETDEVAIKLYSMEASGLESSAIGVVFPENTKQVSEIVRFAYENDLKYILKDQPPQFRDPLSLIQME